MRRVFDALVRFLRESDMFLMVLCLISSIFGIVLIASVTRNMERSFLPVQVGALIIGIVLYVLFSYIDIDTVADKSGILLVVSALFISTLFIWGTGGEEKGNDAWLRFAGIGIQPAEIVKIPYIIIIARMIVNYRDRKSLNDALSVLKILLAFGLLFGLIILSSSDLGSALIYLFVLVVMLFVGGLKLRWFALGGVLLAIASAFSWFYALSTNQRDRILAPYNANIDPEGMGIKWQTSRSVEAIASGRFKGQGLFNGRITQTVGGIPEQQTDFIFSAAGEELGFIGCMLIILLLTIIIIRCVYIGVKSNSTLGLLVCTGVAAMLIIQMAENIGMCLGLSPVIGITLPFFSYGGSSVVTSMAAAGLVSGVKMRPKPVRFRNM